MTAEDHIKFTPISQEPKSEATVTNQNWTVFMWSFSNVQLPRTGVQVFLIKCVVTVDVSCN